MQPVLEASVHIAPTVGQQLELEAEPVFEQEFGPVGRLCVRLRRGADEVVVFEPEGFGLATVQFGELPAECGAGVAGQLSITTINATQHQLVRLTICISAVCRPR